MSTFKQEKDWWKFTHSASYQRFQYIMNTKFSDDKALENALKELQRIEYREMKRS
jgi:hypothetical protein